MTTVSQNHVGLIVNEAELRQECTRLESWYKSELKSSWRFSAGCMASLVLFLGTILGVYLFAPLEALCRNATEGTRNQGIIVASIFLGITVMVYGPSLFFHRANESMMNMERNANLFPDEKYGKNLKRLRELRKMFVA